MACRQIQLIPFFPRQRNIACRDNLFQAVFACRTGDELHIRRMAQNPRRCNPLFIPVNKHGRQKAQYAELLRENLQSGVQVATFPAGLCSRRHRGVVRDCPWRPSFVKNAIESRRDVVPVYFEGELSSFFYNLSNFRTAVGIRANLEMLYLPDEMFRQRGKDFRIRFGEPVPWQRLDDGKPAKVWAERLREYVYKLKNEQKNG